MSDERPPIAWIKVVDRPHPPLFLGVLFDGHEPSVVKHTTGLDAGFPNVKKDGSVLFISEREFASCVQRIHEKVDKEGSSFYRNYATACCSEGNALLSECKQLARRFHKSGQSIATLHESLTQYFQNLVYFAPYLLVTVAAQKTIEDPMEHLLRSVEGRVPDGMKQGNAIRSALLHPLHPTQSELAIYAERRILDEILSNSDLSNEIRRARTPLEAQELLAHTSPTILHKIHSYTQRYSWLTMNYYQGLPETPLSFLRRLLDRLQHVMEATPKSPLLQKDIQRLLTSEERELLTVVQELLFLRTYRLEVFFRAHALLEDLWNAIAARLGLNTSDLPWLTHHELLNATIGPPGKLDSLVASRKKGFSVLKHNGSITWMAPPPVSPPRGTDESAQVEGTTAYPGRVRGIARVANTPEEARSLRPGHLLVTSMTTPAFAPYLHLARGIITDEGGILSHAALLSREAQIPCIVGTNTATSLFTSGDLVDLATDDRGKGLVRRIPWRKGVQRWSPVLWRYFSTVGHGSRYAKPALFVTRGFDYCKNVDHQTYLALDDYETIAAELETQVRADPRYLDRLASSCYAACEDLVQTALALQRETPLLTESQDLLDAFLHYHDATMATIPYRYAVTILDEVITRMLEEMLRSKGLSSPDELQAALGILVLVAQPSFEEEYRAILEKIAQKVGKTLATHTSFTRLPTTSDVHTVITAQPELRAAAEALLQEFSWLSTSYYTGEPLTLANVAEQIMKMLTETPGHKPDTKATPRQAPTREALIRTLALSDTDVHLLEIAGLYAHLRSYRIAICYKADFLVRSLLTRIGARLKVAYEDLIKMTGVEIAESLRRDDPVVYAEELFLRGNAFQFYLVDAYFWVETEDSEKTEAIGKRVLTPLHGRTAHPGFARGTVRIIRGRGEQGKLRPGDVIVTPMTTTDLTLAIRENCVGIITDEGGMTSHAASISRESGIPCIVGTGNATQVLRDGDLVELRAEALGTVEVVEPKKHD